MKRFQIYIAEPLMEQLKKVAQEKGLATSDIIRRACEEYLEKQKNSADPFLATVGLNLNEDSCPPRRIEVIKTKT